MSKATLKPVISKLREIIIKDISGKMEKYGFDDAGRLINNKPLSEYDSVIKNNLVSLFKGKNIEGNKKEYIGYIQDSARTFLHILICFKTMEQRGIMGNIIGRLMNDHIYDAVIPDFINVPPMAFSDLSEKFRSEISSMEEKDNYEEDREYYSFIYMLSALTKEMAKEVPLLFKDYEHNLVQPDFEGLKEILFNINKIDDGEYEEDDFLGWIYQYWVDIKVDELKFAKGEKDISYANAIYYEILNNLEEEQTQYGEFYTPRWVVKYIVDNTLKPYFEENKKIETIKLLDPACGAGNFLVYAFDVFYDLYKIEHPDWPDNHIIGNILEKNIFGVDIQREPLQITAINLWLKAKRKAKDVRIKNLNLFNMNILKANSLYRWENDQEEVVQLSLFQDEIELTERNYTAEDIGQYISAQAFIAKKEAREFFKNKFNVIVMNPPFVDARKMDSTTSEFLKLEYPKNARNLFSAFIERAHELVISEGLIGFLSADTWLYISSFENTRNTILERSIILNSLHLGFGVFDGADVSAITVILRKTKKSKSNQISRFYDLRDSDHTDIQENLKNAKCYEVSQSEFKKIKTNPFIYEISLGIRNTFLKSVLIGEANGIVDIYSGIQVKLNNGYTYKKWEVPQKIMNGYSKFAYDCNGKYLSDLFYLIDWSDESVKRLKEESKKNGYHHSVLIGKNAGEYTFRKGILYSAGGDRFEARLMDDNTIFYVGESAIFLKDQDISELYILGLLNSKFTDYVLRLLNPTKNFQVGDVSRIPFVSPKPEAYKNVCRLTENIIAKKRVILSFNYLSEYFELSELDYGFNKGAINVRDAFEIYLTRVNALQNEINTMQKELDGLIYSIYELNKFDIDTIEKIFPDKIQPARNVDDNELKKVTLSYIRTIIKEHLLAMPPKLYTDEEVLIIVQAEVEKRFGPTNGYRIIEEIEGIFERNLLNLIRGGVKIGSSSTNLCCKDEKDMVEPLLQKKVLSGTGTNKNVVIWHISHFLLEFEGDKKYVMQNEIRRLSNEVYRPRLQTVKEKLQGSIAGAEKKELEKQEKLLSEAVKTLEAWKVVN